MFALLLTPAYAPFAIAFAVMIGIGLIEAVGLGLGHLDLDGGMDGGVDHGGVLDWLGLGGELPILVWLTSLLGCFTLTGIAVQQVATAATGAPIAWGLASAAAAVAGALLNTLAANGLARIMPGFETTAIATDELLRRRGTVLEGTARRGAPTRAKVVDRHGQAHFVMVEPHDDAGTIAHGETALLVRREGKLFFAVADTNTLLQPF
ncbi:OB-fold-containig protein [Sphingomonas sp.]|uniref:OB-fold-containig protein n=1 Tax=Sphingomonas sp. TaxID=28214 RepID=UPI0035BC6DC1